MVNSPSFWNFNSKFLQKTLYDKPGWYKFMLECLNKVSIITPFAIISYTDSPIFGQCSNLKVFYINPNMSFIRKLLSCIKDNKSHYSLLQQTFKIYSHSKQEQVRFALISLHHWKSNQFSVSVFDPRILSGPSSPLGKISLDPPVNLGTLLNLFPSSPFTSCP